MQATVVAVARISTATRVTAQTSLSDAAAGAGRQRRDPPPIAEAPRGNAHREEPTRAITGFGHNASTAATIAATSSSKAKARRKGDDHDQAHNGTLPCLRRGSSSRLVRSIRRPATIFWRVSGGIDHVVDVATLGGVVRVGVLLGVLGDQFGATRRGIGGLLQLAAVDDLDRTLRAHHGELGSRPGVREVGADRLRVHHDVRTAVGLASDDLDARHRGLAVGVQQLGAVADDAAVLLIDAGQEAGHVDERQQRDVERIARAHETGRLLASSRCRGRRRASAAGCRRCRPDGRRRG